MIESIANNTDRAQLFPSYGTLNLPQTSHQTLDSLLSELEAAIALSATAPLAKQALRRVRRLQEAARLRMIIERVARCLCLTPDDLTAHKRGQHVDFCRHIVMYVCKSTGASYPSIGRSINRNHSSVVYGVALIERRVQRDAAFRVFIETLKSPSAG